MNLRTRIENIERCSLHSEFIQHKSRQDTQNFIEKAMAQPDISLEEELDDQLNFIKNKANVFLTATEKWLVKHSKERVIELEKLIHDKE